MVGAAVRKPRVPNDKLHHVTDNRLTEADRKVLHGVCRWSRLEGYRELPVLRALKVSVSMLNLMRASILCVVHMYVCVRLSRSCAAMSAAINKSLSLSEHHAVVDWTV